jgi:hypothetical protein
VISNLKKRVIEGSNPARDLNPLIAKRWRAFGIPNRIPYETAASGFERKATRTNRSRAV